jgi:uncharacterized membrane protein YphA (DoxX/SURF4 family)
MPKTLDNPPTATRIRRRAVSSTGGRHDDRPRASGWRAALAIAAVLLLYIAGLVVAVPLGRVAVAVTLVLAFVVAIFIGGRLWKTPVPPR